MRNNPMNVDKIKWHHSTIGVTHVWPLICVKPEKKVNHAKIDYYKQVWYHTEKNAHKLHNITKRGQEYHIDHIVPISYGFKKGIDPKRIGGIKNLRIISWKENFNKNRMFTTL